MEAAKSTDRQEFADGKMIAEKDGAIGWIIFNNPARHNAVSLEMFQAVPGIIADYDENGHIVGIEVLSVSKRGLPSVVDQAA